MILKLHANFKECVNTSASLELIPVLSVVTTALEVLRDSTVHRG